MKKNLVYSTDKGRLCPDCHAPVSNCKCNSDQMVGDGNVKIKREIKGRGGKTVTTVSGIPLKQSELKVFAKKLKQACGTGGAVKLGIIEIQGDHRKKLLKVLEDEGYSAKLAGG